jgi:putative drug exporter of the RND superfamily
MSSFLYRLAKRSVRHRRLVVLVWLVAVIGVVGFAVVGSGKTTNVLSIPGTESEEANKLLMSRFPESSGATAQVLLVAPDGKTLSDPTVAAEVTKVLTELKSLPSVAAVIDPQQAGALSQDGRVGIAQVQYPMAASAVPLEHVEELLGVATEESNTPLRLEVGGEVPASSNTELGITSELIGIAVAMVVLLLTFGSLVAAGLPIFTGLLGVAITGASIALLANLVDLPSTTSTLAIMIGLAVGIDYALFIVSRHREELENGESVHEAAAIATATAGSAVVFAGFSVIIALAGLVVVGIPFLAYMGLAAAAGVLVAVLVAVTLTPALLAIAGARITKRTTRKAEVHAPVVQSPAVSSSAVQATYTSKTMSDRWAAAVVRRPVIALIGSVLVLGLLSVPVLDLRLGFPDDGSLAKGNTRREAYELVTENYGKGFNSPLTIAVDLTKADDRTAALASVVDQLNKVTGVVATLEPVVNQTGDTAVVVAIPKTGPADTETERTIKRVRDVVALQVQADTGARVLVTGLTAVNIDVSNKLIGALAPFLILVLGLMLVLLVLAFRSIVIALKAVIAILLSVGASFGVLVAVFQWGWLAKLIGVDASLPIVSFLPVIMFAILFGLSMDYEVFILSRVKERITAGDGASDSVLHGLGVSARVITAAALIMIAVFGSFVGQTDPTIKMFGVGLAAAVFLDATIVRMVFVPAALTLLGTRAWQLPSWLDRFVPDLDIEGHKLVRTETEQRLAHTTSAS